MLGVALSIAALGGVVFALIEGPDVGWTSPEVLVTGAVGLLAGVLFVRAQLRRRYPLFTCVFWPGPRSPPAPWPS